MKKSFFEILAEKDEEFTYHVKSTVDIHQPEFFERVRHTLLPYRIKEIKTDGYTPWSKANKTFPDQPNSATYSIKVVTGLPIDTKRVLETMAMVCHVHVSHLKMMPDDDVASGLVGEPKEVDKTTSQLLVGSKRIGEFVKELQKDRKDREKKTVTREVYESFFTTHRSLENVLKRPIRKGYYMIEMSGDSDQTYMQAEGPFPERTDGNLYRDTIAACNPQIVSEADVNGMYRVNALIEKIAVAPGDAQMFEVKVSDMNSGRRFTSMVRAMTPDDARKMAVHQVAEANRIDPTGLTAMAPKPAA